jgi:hypothetical protein
MGGGVIDERARDEDYVLGTNVRANEGDLAYLERSGL